MAINEVVVKICNVKINIEKIEIQGNLDDALIEFSERHQEQISKNVEEDNKLIKQIAELEKNLSQRIMGGMAQRLAAKNK